MHVVIQLRHDYDGISVLRVGTVCHVTAELHTSVDSTDSSHFANLANVVDLPTRDGAF